MQSNVGYSIKRMFPYHNDSEAGEMVTLTLNSCITWIVSHSTSIS